MNYATHHDPAVICMRRWAACCARKLVTEAPLGDLALSLLLRESKDTFAWSRTMTLTLVPISIGRQVRRFREVAGDRFPVHVRRYM